MFLFKEKGSYLLSFFIVLFGVVTIFSGGRNLFTEIGIQTRGEIVPLVLWYNFIAGFFYVLTGLLIFKKKILSKKLAGLIALTSLLIFTYLIFYIQSGGLYQTKTLFAMGFRTLIWVAIAIYLQVYFRYKKRDN